MFDHFGARAQACSKAFQICSNMSATQDSELSVVYHALLVIFQKYLSRLLESEFFSKNFWMLLMDFLMIFRYLVFYCPQDIFYRCFAFLPLRLLVAGMKEVTRTWKITAGIAHADSHFKDAWLVMVAVGWARGNMHNISFWLIVMFWSGI